jgi:hypothetical protein
MAQDLRTLNFISNVFRIPLFHSGYSRLKPQVNSFHWVHYMSTFSPVHLALASVALQTEKTHFTLLYPWSVYRDQLIILSFVDNSINYNRNFQLKTCCSNTGDCKCKGKHQHVKSCCIWVKGMHQIVIPINEKDVVLGYPSVVHTEYPAKKQSDISNYISWM